MKIGAALILQVSNHTLGMKIWQRIHALYPYPFLLQWPYLRLNVRQFQMTQQCAASYRLLLLGDQSLHPRYVLWFWLIAVRHQLHKSCHQRVSVQILVL